MTPQMNTADRRRALIHWIKERSAHSGLTAREIVDLCPGIYHGDGSYDRCIADLKHFNGNGQIWRDAGRPARWAA